MNKRKMFIYFMGIAILNNGTGSGGMTFKNHLKRYFDEIIILA
jgi:hypothetical protein